MWESISPKLPFEGDQESLLEPTSKWNWHLQEFPSLRETGTFGRKITQKRFWNEWDNFDETRHAKSLDLKECFKGVCEEWSRDTLLPLLEVPGAFLLRNLSGRSNSPRKQIKFPSAGSPPAISHVGIGNVLKKINYTGLIGTESKWNDFCLLFLYRLKSVFLLIYIYIYIYIIRFVYLSVRYQ